MAWGQSPHPSSLVGNTPEDILTKYQLVCSAYVRLERST